MAAETSSARGDWVLVPREVVDFLMGEGELQGVWFGETPAGESRWWFWRKHLRHAKDAALAAEGVQAEPKDEAQLTYKGVPIGPMQTFADIERQATVLADPRAAAEQAIAEALRRERMAPDDYKPMPDSPVPMESDDE